MPLHSAIADMISTKSDNHLEGALIILLANGISKSSSLACKIETLLPALTDCRMREAKSG